MGEAVRTSHDIKEHFKAIMPFSLEGPSQSELHKTEPEIESRPRY